MDSLPERIEAAEGPSFALEQEIFRAVNPQATDQSKPPAYTASIDAAMTLVPEGWEWMMEGEETERHFPSSPWLYQAHLGRDIKGEGSTPALALCAAALRAKEQPNEG